MPYVNSQLFLGNNFLTGYFNIKDISSYTADNVFSPKIFMPLK